jgi:CubicO group peptidase (beta-lactamase class C family)
MGYTGNWLSGNATHTDLLKFQKLFDQPLLHAPGSQYCYVNSNFQLAGYIVEKVCEP